MTTKTKSKAMKEMEGIVGPLTIGGLLESIRLGEEWSQAEMAERLHVSRSHICDVEKGRKAVAPVRAREWAKLLGYSEAQFVRLALQAQVEEAGLRFRVELRPA